MNGSNVSDDEPLAMNDLVAVNGREDSPGAPQACQVQASRDGWSDGGEEKVSHQNVQMQCMKYPSTTSEMAVRLAN